MKWGTLGDAPSVAVHPEIVEVMKDAGCSYISFGFESASDKVLTQDIHKGQLRKHEQITIDAIKIQYDTNNYIHDRKSNRRYQ